MNKPADDIVLDVCGLEPPEPLERILEALSDLAPGRRLCVMIGREPFPLYRILEQNGFAHQTRCREDFIYEVLIWHRNEN